MEKEELIKLIHESFGDTEPTGVLQAIFDFIAQDILPEDPTMTWRVEQLRGMIMARFPGREDLQELLVDFITAKIVSNFI